MKELTKIFKNIEIPVEISDNGNMYFDVSGIIGSFDKNKRLARWKKLDSTQEYIKTVQKCTSLNESELLITIGNTVKIHEELLIEFAGYVSSEFKFEANKIIKDILFGEKLLIGKRELDLLKTIELKNNQLTNSQKETESAIPQSYGQRRPGRFQCVHWFIREYNIDISADKLNDILIDEGILTTKRVDRHIPAPHDPLSKYDKTTILVNEDTLKMIIDDRNIGVITDNQLFFDL